MAAIGQILACPKCGSMVQVLAPDGWQPPEVTDSSLSQTSGSLLKSQDSQPSDVKLADGKSSGRPPADGKSLVSKSADSRSSDGDVKSASGDHGKSDATTKSYDSPLAGRSGVAAQPAVDPPALAGAAANGPQTAMRRPRWQQEVTRDEPAAVGAVAADAVGAGIASGDATPAVGDDLPSNAPPRSAGGLLANWGLLIGMPLVGMCLGIGFMMWWKSGQTVEITSAPPVAEAPASPVPPDSPSVEPELPEPPMRTKLDRRWLPPETQAVFSLRLGELREQPAAEPVVRHLSVVWNQAVETLYREFRLTASDVRRFTWVATDVAGLSEARWPAAGVIVLELSAVAAENDTLAWLDQCEELGWRLNSISARQFSAGGWPHPFVRVEPRTLVTGPAALVQSLNKRGEDDQIELSSEALDRLLDILNAESQVLAAIDLRAVRSADVMPSWTPLVELWHVPRDDWQVVREMPLALGMEMHWAERLKTELYWECESETAAQQVHSSVDRCLATIAQTIASEQDLLTQNLQAGRITTAGANQLKLLWAGCRTALEARESGVDNATVWVRSLWSGDLANLSLAAAASVPQLETARLAAARTIDETNLREILLGLAGYEKAEHAFPRGAGGAELLPPEERLSWLATMLPYFGRLDWHSELNFALPWNDVRNQPVTRRPLDLLLNPALGPRTTKAGFPMTHYVGVAGLGTNAAELEPTDRRAGVFGFRERRRVSLSQIGDGASNTIALAGVSDQLGAWSAGGGATVRPFTRQPYINGPDGFGSGQPDGMLVGMADGSVRFLSKDIDPAVLEHLVTINGGEPAPLVVRPAPPEPKPEPVVADDTPDKPRPDRGPSAPPAKPKGNVAALLDAPIMGVEFDRVPLKHFVELLSNLSTAIITLDIEALAAAGVPPDIRVSVKLSDTTIGQALTAALEEPGLVYIVSDEQVLVTTPSRRESQPEIVGYDVADLAGDEEATAALASLVKRLIDPPTWESAGGLGRLKIESSKLDVEQSGQVQRELSLFLDKLRLARSKRGPRQAEFGELSLATRFDQAEARLQAPVTANFRQPTRLSKIVRHLQEASETHIVFDGLSLLAVGLSSDMDGTLVADKQPLGEALKSLLEPLDLAYRVIDDRTLQIVTRRTAQERLDLEFYLVRDLLSDDETLDSLRERIMGQLARKSWDEAGGPGVIGVDPASACLIVLQSQAVQMDLEKLLDAWRSASAPDDGESEPADKPK